MAKCLRCGAGNEWIEGTAKAPKNPLHAAAPAMYEALKGVADFFKSEVGNGGWIYKVREALAAANPETDKTENP